MTECVRCLLDDGLPGITLSAAGLCEACSEPAPPATEAKLFHDRLVRGEIERRGDYDAIVAFSGGKDSVGTLVHLSRQSLRLRAVLFDNGFIPSPVIEQAHRIAERCGADFEVVSQDLTAAFRGAIASRTFDPAPCTICMRAVWTAMDAVAGRYGSEIVCSGHRYPPGLKALERTHLRWTLAVPVAASLSSTRLAELRAEVGYEEPAVPGQSSNCLVPRAVELAYEDWFGFNPALFELSKEVRSGLVSKDEARAALQRKSALPAHEPTLIKLGLRSSPEKLAEDALSKAH